MDGVEEDPLNGAEDPTPPIERVELITLDDPLEASMLHDLLEKEGVAVVAHGKRLTRLDVPVDELERANAIMERERFTEDAAPDAEPQRKKRIAAFCAIGLTLGCGHFYARSYRVGLTLAALQASCFALVWGYGFSIAMIGLPFVVFADLAGAMVAVDRYNGVPRPDAWAKVTLALPAGAALVIGLFPGLYWLAPDTLVSDEAAVVCEARERCTGRSEVECRHHHARLFVQRAEDHVEMDACSSCIERRGPACDDLCACQDECYRVASIADCRDRW